MKTKLITHTLFAALSIGTIGAAAAQAPAPGLQAGKSQEGHPRGHGLRGHGGGVDALARLDTDNDGRLSRAEVLAAQQAREAHRAERTARGDAARPQRGDGERRARGPGGPHARGFDLVRDFDAIDGDRDGYLTRAELRTWHAAKSTERRAEGARRFEAKFVEADLNGDGKLSRVEVAEKMPRLAERFAWLDENRDGFLSREELRGGRPQR
ncbi:MAG: hypothetical protein ABW163_13215 [Luteimonas sp.]